MDRSGTLAEEQGRRFRLLAEVARLSASRIEPAALARGAIERLVAELPADRGAIYLVEGDELVLLTTAGSVPPPGAERTPVVSLSARFLSQPPGGVDAWSIDDATPVGREMLERAGTRVVASAALSVTGSHIGLMHLGRATAQPFSAGDLALVSAVAAQLGPGLSAATRLARGDGEARATGRELSVLQRAVLAASRTLDLDSVLDACLDLAEELTGAEYLAIFVGDEGSADLHLARHRGGTPLFVRVPRATLARFIHVEALPVVDDVDALPEPYRGACRAQGLATTVTVPLRDERGLSGVFTLAFRARQAFSRATLSTLLAVGEQQAGAIGRARVHALAETRARLSDHVRTVAERALSAATPEALYDAILDGLGAVTSMPCARLTLCDDTGELRTAREHGLPEPLARITRLSHFDPMVRWLSQLEGPLEVRDAATLPSTSVYRALFEEAHIASLLILPLRRGGRMTGVLAAMSQTERPLHREHLNALGLLGSVAASALEADHLRAEADAQRLRLGQIIESLPVCVAVVGVDGRVEQLNAMMRALIPSARPGGSWKTAFADAHAVGLDGAPVDPEQLASTYVLRAEEAPARELRFHTPNGWRHLLTTAIALRSDGGDLVGVVAIGQDVTALRDLADSRDRFLRMATHELSNPLASVQGLVNRLSFDESALTDRGKRADYLARLRRQVDRMTRLVHDLQDFERLREGRLRLVRERCDLREVAREAIEPAQHDTDKHAIELLASAPVTGEWDRVRLAQVLANLVSNAMRYSPDGGAIRVHVRAEGSEAVVAVEDQGIGIPPALRRQLFEPGFRGKEAGKLVPTGSGLGLYITQEIVRRHGGRIEVHSETGRGSRFVVFLPRTAPPDSTT